MMRDPKTGKFERITGSAEQIDKALKTKNTVWIYTKDSNVQAFTDLLNRCIDKPSEHVEIGGADGGPSSVHGQREDHEPKSIEGKVIEIDTPERAVPFLRKKSVHHVNNVGQGVGRIETCNRFCARFGPSSAFFLDAVTFYKAVFHARGYRRSPRTCFCANSSAYTSSAKQELGELPTPFALRWLSYPVCSTGGTLSPSSNPTC